jgi:HPt (histidine-containing phosphotransfer) domain-containing protein
MLERAAFCARACEVIMPVSEPRRAPVSPSVPRESPVDLSDLWGLGGSTASEAGPNFVHDVIELFLRLAPENYAVARTALRHGDAQSLWRAIHKLKSQAAYFGAKRLVQACRTLEGPAYGGQLSRCERYLDDLEDGLDRVIVALQPLRRTALRRTP